MVEMSASRIIGFDLDQPRHDQAFFANRLRHFYSTINPLFCVATDKELDDAMAIVQRYRTLHAGTNTISGTKTSGTNVSGTNISGTDSNANSFSSTTATTVTTTTTSTSDENIWQSKHLVDSAFHPDTKEKIPVPGRLSFTAPGCTLICSAMLLFTGPVGSVVSQVGNQSWMSYTNYANRNGTCPVDATQLAQGYALAVGGSVVALLQTKSYCAKHVMGGFAGRVLPAGMACCVAHCLNVPFTRHRELIDGVDVFTQVYSSRIRIR